VKRHFHRAGFLFSGRAGVVNIDECLEITLITLNVNHDAKATPSCSCGLRDSDRAGLSRRSIVVEGSRGERVGLRRD
jgi:hypothetical protein